MDSEGYQLVGPPYEIYLTDPQKTSIQEDTVTKVYFPEYVPDAAGRQKQEITLCHLLTMIAPYPFEDWHEPLDRLCMSPDWVKYALDMLGQKGNIGAFKYCTAGAHLLSAIITRSTGKNVCEFANEHLFGPIGMKAP